MPQGFSIAIDGPVASGKETLAQSLADRLSGFHLYTGAMYRCVALLCIQKGIDMNSEEEVLKVLGEVKVAFKNKKVFLGDIDITDRIKDPNIAEGASVVGVYKSVRENLVKKQQKIANQVMENGQIVIAEGRDTGTKVLPNAKLKIFLTASPLVRSKRRLVQYEKQGIHKNEEEVLKEIEIRDQRDVSRDVDPLPSDPSALGYWILDTSSQSENESVETVLTELKKRGLVNA